MARKAISGLYQKGGVWQIDKVFRGERLRESTGTSDRQEAEQYLTHRLEQLRQQRYTAYAAPEPGKKRRQGF
ncbi:hypothetical protein D3C73_1524170 [compost metagenome]